MQFHFTRFVRASAFAALCLLTSMSGALAFDDKEKSEIESIVREYLLKNPEIMLEVQQALESKRQAEVAALQQRTLTEMKDRIYKSEHQVAVGDENAPITVVEFYDYNCGFCQRAFKDMDRFLKEDGKNVRFILKEFPVLGEPSMEAHRISLAFNKLMPDQAADYHAKLINLRGRKNGQAALDIAATYGVDTAELKAEAAKPYIDEAIQEVYQMADGLGITGTPSYVIGDEVVFGAVGYAQLKERVENLIAN